jgi:prepilin-type N-terminal cleavage/methylation domain-containing protein
MSHNKGFTIVEILIAMVVLSVGLLGLLGVFPAGIRKTSEIVEDSNAAIIAEGVRNSIQLALERARIEEGSEKGFIYLGEGVEALMDEKGDVMPIDITTHDGTPASINKAADYWVKLPYDSDEEYLYPRWNPSVFEMDDYVLLEAAVPGGLPREVEPVKRVFPCGWDIVKAAKDPSLTTAERDEANKDPFSQYSYAFSVKEAKVGDPPAVTADHSLYELTIYIYRNFPSNLFKQGNEMAGFSNDRHNYVKKFKTLISF